MARARLFGARYEGGVPGAVVIAEARDGFREDLDAAARRCQPVRVGIATEGAQETAIVVGGGQRQLAARPEFVEGRRVPASGVQCLACRLIEMSQPLLDVAAFGEGFAGAHPLRKLRI